MRKSNEKKICADFLIEVALLAHQGSTIKQSAEKLDCNVGTIRKAREHELYERVFETVMKTRIEQRLADLA